MEKKLYKSRTDKKICGVCAGIADYFDIDSLPGIYQELSNIAINLGSNLILLHKFFEENTSYTGEKVAEYLGVEVDDTKKILKDYADFELGIEIADAVRTTGQCEFTAEL